MLTWTISELKEDNIYFFFGTGEVVTYEYQGYLAALQVLEILDLRAEDLGPAAALPQSRLSVWVVPCGLLWSGLTTRANKKRNVWFNQSTRHTSLCKLKTVTCNFNYCFLWMKYLPSALSVSLGMLFPAISSCTMLLFFCRASNRDLPPSRPMLFHLRSVTAIRRSQSYSGRRTISDLLQENKNIFFTFLVHFLLIFSELTHSYTFKMETGGVISYVHYEWHTWKERSESGGTFKPWG